MAMTKAKLEKALDAALETRVDAAFAVLAQGLGNTSKDTDQRATVGRTFSNSLKGLMVAHGLALEAIAPLFEKPER